MLPCFIGPGSRVIGTPLRAQALADGVDVVDADRDVPEGVAELRSRGGPSCR